MKAYFAEYYSAIRRPERATSIQPRATPWVRMHCVSPAPCKVELLIPRVPSLRSSALG